MNLALLTMLTFPQRWLLQQEVPPVKRDPGCGSWEYLLHWLRNDSVARLVISVPSTTETKTQVPKNPLLDTFTLTLLRDGASAWRRHSTASRAVKHLLQTASALVTKISKDVPCLINNILKDLLVLRVSEEWARYRTRSMTSGILWLESCWEGELAIAARKSGGCTFPLNAAPCDWN